MKFLVFLLIFLACDGSNSHLQEQGTTVDRRPPATVDPGGHLHVALFSDDLGNDIQLGQVAKGRSYTLSLEIQNLGDLQATLKQVRSETQSFDLQYNDDCLLNLKPKKTCKFKIYLKAKTLGTTNGFISFLFQSIDGQEQSVGLSFGAVVVNNNRVLNPMNYRYVQNNELSFGRVSLGSKKRVLVELQNPEEVTRTLDKLFIRRSLDDAIHFAGGEFPGENGNCGRIFKQGNCLIELEFTPKKQTRYSSQLELSFEDRVLNLRIVGNGAMNTEGRCEETWESFVYDEGQIAMNQYPFPYVLIDTFGQDAVRLVYGTESTNDSTANRIGYNSRAQAYLQFPQLDQIKNQPLKHVELDVKVSQYYNSQSYKTKNPRSYFCMSSSTEKKCSGVAPKGSLWTQFKNKDFWEAAKESNKNFHLLFKNLQPKKRFHNGFNYKVLDKRLSLSQILGLQVDAFKKIFDHSNVGFFLVDNLKWEDDPRLVLTFNRDVSCVPE